jgi:DNA-binding response OmpR family regulator
MTVPNVRRSPLVVVINDDPAFLELAQSLLEHKGYRVEIRMAGTGARSLVRDLRPDLVILDLRLGDRNGHDVFQALTLDPRTTDVPVLICSAASEQLRRMGRRVQQLGGDVLPKPFTPDQLFEKVAKLLRQPKRRDASPKEISVIPEPPTS